MQSSTTVQLNMACVGAFACHWTPFIAKAILICLLSRHQDGLRCAVELRLHLNYHKLHVNENIEDHFWPEMKHVLGIIWSHFCKHFVTT